MTNQIKPIIGQDAICPDGLGYVIKFCLDTSDCMNFSEPWIQVKTRVNDRSRKWAAHRVTLLALPPVAITVQNSEQGLTLTKEIPTVAEKEAKPEALAQVKPNFCNCHPETCGCDDWAVYIGKEKHSTHFHKSVAQLVANALNQGVTS